ncbi:MAG: histidinol dehydrogenase, partial [Atopobiaceae bacterium]|nr:histidinol dehydrogenase [Atopobiaceae bacterium]
AALPPDVVATAEAIVADVAARGDEAVREVTLRVDGACPEAFRVPDEAIDAACESVDPRFIDSLEKAARQIREFHEHELLRSDYITHADGTVLGVRVTPIANCGIYIPGGRAQYPSTVLMNAIPAKVAGVGRIIMCTPAKDGLPSPYTLAAARIAGVDEVYAIGGAQAIAAMAYGTESIPKVDKITGPGNAYVAAAKRCVSGFVGIDMIAGPSEVCVLADASADPVTVAADLMAQAEHDPMAACYLITCDGTLPARVETALEALLVQSPREDITRTSLSDKGVIVVCETIEQATEAVNTVAPEHLELHCEDAFGLLDAIRNAGAIFIGAWSSEPLGDYVAGPNHTLPTGGTARFSNPLGVYDFQKRSSVIAYTPAGFAADAPDVQVLAQAEGLWAHALSVGVRLEALAKGEDALAGESFASQDMARVAWPFDLSEPIRPASNEGMESEEGVNR